MEKSKQIHRDALLAELDLHKAEFSALREEILQWLDSERQHLNLSILAIGAGLGFLPFILERRVYIVLLLLPFVFHVLLWEMLNSLRATASLSGYLVETLIPRVNAILDQLGDEREGVMTFGWEVREAKRSVRASQLLLASMTPTRHWVPILAIAALIISYIVIITGDQVYSPTLTEILLVFVNLILLILAAIRNLFIIRIGQNSARLLD